MTARILIADDNQLQRWTLRDSLTAAGYQTLEAESGQAALEVYRRDSPDLVLLDLKLGADSGLDVLRDLRAYDPDAVVIMISGHGGLDDAVAGFRHGLVDYFTKPINLKALEVAIRYRLEVQRLRGEVARWRQQDAAGRGDTFIGSAPSLIQALRVMRRVAASPTTTVLLEGESGTGKDLLARVLHRESPQKDGPFLAVNCASLPEALLESELFGHERGAFTDAHAMKRGVFELAHDGTLYLDEVGELKLSLQAKLLRVLETFSFRRVGGVHDIRVNTRIVAASNRDLETAVQEGAFRSDLYYRLKVIQITLPPLRERREDIPELAAAFVREASERLRRPIVGLTPEALAALCRHDWPGNIRELRNAIERAVILEDEPNVTTRHLPLPTGALSGSDDAPTVRLPPGGVSLEVVEEELVRQAMQASDNNQSQAARLLGIGRDALRYRLKRMGLLGGDADDG